MNRCHWGHVGAPGQASATGAGCQDAAIRCEPRFGQICAEVCGHDAAKTISQEERRIRAVEMIGVLWAATRALARTASVVRKPLLSAGGGV